jgi:hypothetical protein
MKLRINANGAKHQMEPNNMNNTFRVLAIVMVMGFVAAITPQTASASPIINGDFQTGDLTGWTIFNTATGTAGNPNVVSFATNGTASLAAHFNVGMISGLHGVGDYQGGGLQQNIFLTAGTYDLFYEFAANGTGNADGGLFSLILDGVTVDSYNIGAINGIFRGSLSGQISVTSGLHNLQVEVRRQYYQPAVDQYIDNVTISPVGVPEPNSLGLLGLGSTILLALRYRFRTGTQAKR